MLVAHSSSDPTHTMTALGKRNQHAYHASHVEIVLKSADVPRRRWVGTRTSASGARLVKRLGLEVWLLGHPDHRVQLFQARKPESGPRRPDSSTRMDPVAAIGAILLGIATSLVLWLKSRR